MSYDFYRTGKQDCGNTFDRETFDIDIRELARKAVMEARRSGSDVRSIASKLALHALRKCDEWMDPKVNPKAKKPKK